MTILTREKSIGLFRFVAFAGCFYYESDMLTEPEGAEYPASASDPWPDMERSCLLL